MRAAPLAFLLSGSGSTLTNLLSAIGRGAVDARIVAVVSDRPGVRGLEHAREHGIPALVVPRSAHRGGAYSAALEAALVPYEPEWIVLGGFLTCFPVPNRFAGRIVNVHPSLLPAFGGSKCYGLEVHRRVLERGCRVSGCTVHLVDDIVDGGPILEQAVVPVEADDTPATLAARVQAAERALYPQVLQALVTGRWRLDGARILRDEPARLPGAGLSAGSGAAGS